MMEASRPDVVFLDLRMPTSTAPPCWPHGRRARLRDVPVVIVVGRHRHRAAGQPRRAHVLLARPTSP
jgi:CheY-like chemotaxis protein